MTTKELTEDNVRAFARSELELRKRRTAPLRPLPPPAPVLDEKAVAELRELRPRLAEANRQIETMEQELEVLRADEARVVAVVVAEVVPTDEAAPTRPPPPRSTADDQAAAALWEQRLAQCQREIELLQKRIETLEADLRPPC